MGVPYGDEFEKVTMAEAVQAWRRRGYYLIHVSDLPDDLKERAVEESPDEPVRS